ncbi:MAG: hypothetical protein U5L45_12190 [Saprospiraceae bacterium]|nr:hypothetical protein [Saprospiraceae bacterium]
MKTCFNGRILNGAKLPNCTPVIMLNNKIVEIVDENKISLDVGRVNLQECIFAPALVGLQVCGGNGYLFGKYGGAILAVEPMNA